MSGLVWSVDLVVSGLPVDDFLHHWQQLIFDVFDPVVRNVEIHDVAFLVLLLNLKKTGVASLKSAEEAGFVDVEWAAHR